MVALLKQKSKVTIQHKPRVKYPIKSVFKRPKVDDSITKSQKDQVDQILGTSGTGKTAGKITPTIIEKYDENMQS